MLLKKKSFAMVRPALRVAFPMPVDTARDSPADFVRGHIPGSFMYNEPPWP
jgi:hypothetical protein